MRITTGAAVRSVSARMSASPESSVSPSIPRASVSLTIRASTRSTGTEAAASVQGAGLKTIRRPFFSAALKIASSPFSSFWITSQSPGFEDAKARSRNAGVIPAFVPGK